MNTSLLARGPLIDWHRRAGATVETVDGWEIAVRYPPGAALKPAIRGSAAAEPRDSMAGPGPAHARDGSNLLIDRSHLAVFEINGSDTAALLTGLFGLDVHLRRIHSDSGRDVYRLTPARAIVFGTSAVLSGGNGDPVRSLQTAAIDVTGGWATISLVGPGAEPVLNKVTAVDLRERTLPVGACCQGPVFGVNTLFGRFPGRFDLHVCTDSAEFFWEVLLDAGREFNLQPAGLEAFR